MFGWATGIRRQMPSVTVEKAVKSFSEHYDIEEDEYPIETMKNTFWRMSNELIDFQRTPDRGK